MLAFAELTPLERQLLGLRELAGLSYAELALGSGRTVPAVESALHRARRRLLARYGPLSGERALDPRARRTAAPPTPV